MSAAVPPPIHAVDVSKTYGAGATAVTALVSGDLTLRPGELVMLVGPSGSGKTTFLSILGGILRPTAGSVRIAGTEIAGLPERALPAIRRQHIGFVFQSFNLFPALTAAENVALALDVRGVPRREQLGRAHARLDAVGLADKAATLPANLSGGQKQRVAIARALVSDPTVVLADEPTAALDSTSGTLVMELLRSLADRDGRAILVVTHDSRTYRYADRIVEVRDGRTSPLAVPA